MRRPRLARSLVPMARSTSSTDSNSGSGVDTISDRQPDSISAS